MRGILDEVSPIHIFCYDCYQILTSDRILPVDGKPLPTNNPGDTQKLNNAVLKLKTDVDTAQKREIASRSKIAEAKSLVQKKNSNITQGQRATASLASSIKKKKMMLHEVKSGRLDLSVADTPDKAENRVKESTALLNMTADMRREQLNQKRNSSTSSTWVQNLPGLPAPLRRSLWYKMHRRRHQIVLRPSNASMINDLKKQVKSKFISSNGTQRLSDDALEAELIRVEQLFLLATHPVALVGNSVSSIPTVSSWAEPGTPSGPCRCKSECTLRQNLTLFSSILSFVHEYRVAFGP
jgi:hypothetical protein